MIFLAININGNEIKRKLNRLMGNIRPLLKGDAIAIVKDRKPLYIKGYGIVDVANQRAVDTDTVFKIASYSKVFTTEALVILVDKAQLNWQDKVVTYLPEFAMYDP